MNSAKRRQLKLKARREARINMAVEVFGWVGGNLRRCCNGKGNVFRASLYNVILTRGVYTVNNQINNALCDLYDIRGALSAEIKNQLKDNEGTEATIGDCLADVIALLEQLDKAMSKFKRLLQLVLLFAGGFVAGSLIMAVFILGFRAITAV
jgi:hypothetical protein